MPATDGLTPNPRYISIPTLFASLISAHMLHEMCEPLEFGSVGCSLVYLLGLSVPVAIKRAIAPVEHHFPQFLDPQALQRLPTSRFNTSPGPNER